MAEDHEDKPNCYGKLELVFPKGQDGLRHSPESCVPCFCKTECLRKVMAGEEGLRIRAETTQRAYESGAIGFFERWSKQKALSLKMDKKKVK